MNTQPDFETLLNDAVAWRHHLHETPELLYDLPQTSTFVAEKLRDFGCDEVVTGIATSGVVGVIEGRLGAGHTIALRADMDALPIYEETNLPYASKVTGKMHACGHDGHTATLLAAARQLAETRDFSGRVVLLFTPAEEGGAGSRKMVEEGTVERFGIEEVYGMHNLPGLPVGSFASRPGALLAAGDRFVITLTGKGGHAAKPHMATDQVLAVSQLVSQIHALRSRTIDPMDQFVISLTYIQSGAEDKLNVLPQVSKLGGTMRTMEASTRASAEATLRTIAAATAQMFGIEVSVDWRPGYPVMANDPAMTAHSLKAAAAVAGQAQVNGAFPAEMGSDDFAYFLEKVPGSYIWLGNGDSASLHHPAYNFNDAALEHGMRYWQALVAERLGGRENGGGSSDPL